ncbi:putative chromate transport protein [Marinomonas aquimarina]|uniref:Putative chromate transport protein n=1 Tax=Marinomonas aquimarina TaxID=295068 RepID=A0A1A8TNU0_9GAMM|nr:chromate efflux transporter [Marinomonas aquimarina]SBS35514.1 putative chromate transport protein [Marinomonas aquimarina]
MFLTIFWKFLLLGCTSFGGPAAHIGYFRKEFVERLGWATEAEYAQWVALSQIMPGPGSSQVGFALGYHRGGISGALAAFMGFTLPSVILMCVFAALGSQFAEHDVFLGILSALKLMAVVVVADAIWGMGNSFCQSKRTRLIAILSMLFILLWPLGLGSLLLVLLAGVGGALWLKDSQTKAFKSRMSSLVAFSALGLFALLFIVTAFIEGSGWLALSAQLFQVGSLVFGGGHVVLPLMSELLADLVSTSNLLTGYAAAQAVPGPMFTLATYVGAVSAPAGQMIVWALLATLAIFLPGLLLMLVGQHFWQGLSHYPRVQGAVVAINAAVVGLLVATLLIPILPSSVTGIWQALVVILAFTWLRWKKPAIWQLVSVFVLGGVVTALF